MTGYELSQNEEGAFGIRRSNEEPAAVGYQQGGFFDLESVIREMAREFGQSSCHIAVFAMDTGRPLIPKTRRESSSIASAATDIETTLKNFMVIPMQATFDMFLGVMQQAL